jgi:hypothetical protein
MTIEITYRDKATGQPTGHPAPFRDARPGEEVVIVIDGPPLPPAEPCHVCCPPGETCHASQQASRSASATTGTRATPRKIA